MTGSTLGSLAVLGEISINGTMIKVDELANTLQCCLDSGAKKVLIPSVSMMDFAMVPADLMGAFQLIPYSSAEDAFSIWMKSQPTSIYEPVNRMTFGQIGWK